MASKLLNGSTGNPLLRFSKFASGCEALGPPAWKGQWLSQTTQPWASWERNPFEVVWKKTASQQLSDTEIDLEKWDFTVLSDSNKARTFVLSFTSIDFLTIVVNKQVREKEPGPQSLINLGANVGQTFWDFLWVFSFWLFDPRTKDIYESLCSHGHNFIPWHHFHLEPTKVVCCSSLTRFCGVWMVSSS